MIAADQLSVAEIRLRLTASLVGRQLYVLGEVDSTNAVAGRLAREGAPEGTGVLADAQTAGRGLLGRHGFSPAGVNLYASVLLRPALPMREAGRFSLIASLAVADAIEDLGLSPTVKWPNKVLVDQKKVAAVRVDCVARGAEIAHLVLGMELNVNVEPAAIRDALAPFGGEVTSLRAALGRDVNRNALAAGYLSRLDAWARRCREEGSEAILAAWRDRDIVMGRRVETRGPLGGSFGSGHDGARSVAR